MSQTERIQRTIDAMTNAFGKGDIDGVMRTYEQGAVVVGEPGVPLTGTPALRAMFARFVALSPTSRSLITRSIEAGDVALHLNKWRMTGVAPDGSVVGQGGLSVGRPSPPAERRVADGDRRSVRGLDSGAREQR